VVIKLQVICNHGHNLTSLFLCHGIIVPTTDIQETKTYKSGKNFSDL